MKFKIAIAAAFLILGIVIGWIFGFRVGKNWTAYNLPIMRFHEKQQQDEISNLTHRIEFLTLADTNKTIQGKFRIGVTSE